MNGRDPSNKRCSTLMGIRVLSGCWWPICMMGTKSGRLWGQQSLVIIVGILGEFPPSQMSSWYQMPFHDRRKEAPLVEKLCWERFLWCLEQSRKGACWDQDIWYVQVSRLSVSPVGRAAPPLMIPICTNTGAWRCWGQLGKHCRNAHSSATNPTALAGGPSNTRGRRSKMHCLALVFLQLYAPEQAGAKPWRCILGKDSCGHPLWLGMGSTSCGVPLWPYAGGSGPAESACCTASPRTRDGGWGQLTPALLEESAKPWPEEILISRNKSLFHLIGWSFPMV